MVNKAKVHDFIQAPSYHSHFDPDKQRSQTRILFEILNLSLNFRPQMMWEYNQQGKIFTWDVAENIK